MLETSPHTTAKPYKPRAKRLKDFLTGETCPPDVRRRILEIYNSHTQLREIKQVIRIETGYLISTSTICGILQQARVLRGQGIKHDDATHDRAVAMYRDGYGVYAIARLLTKQLPRSIAASTVRKWVLEAGIYGITPTKLSVCTEAEQERRQMIGAWGYVRESSKLTSLETTQALEAEHQRRRTKEAQHPERQRWLPVIAAATKRFGAMPRYIDHLRNIARMRYADFATDSQIRKAFHITPTQLATDDDHPFALALAKFVWSHSEGSMSRTCMRTLLRSGVSFLAVNRLYGEMGYAKSLRQVAEELGYVQPSQLPTKENDHGC